MWFTVENNFHPDLPFFVLHLSCSDLWLLGLEGKFQLYLHYIGFKLFCYLNFAQFSKNETMVGIVILKKKRI